MYIPIIYAGPFPYGFASANRVLSYAVEMAKLGHEVHVLSLVTYNQPFTEQERADFMSRHAITYKGIQVEYVSGTEFWPEGRGGKLKKLWLFIKGLRGSYRFLKKNRERVSFMLLYSTMPFLYSYFSSVAKRIDAQFIVERSELPSIAKEKEFYEKTIRGRSIIRRVKKSFKKPDGWILETQILADYYMPLAKKNASHLIVPMTVDIEKFSEPSKNDCEYTPYFAYCGNMSEVDGVSILIRAFADVSNEYPEYKLVLAGDSPEVPKQKELVHNLLKDDKIIFLGRVSSNDVPQFLKNAYALVLASPTSIRSCATMPCKVGEYLCASNPVVVTNLGEIPKYLTDGVSAYLAEPDSPVKFAESLLRVIRESPEVNERIGQSGYEVAVNNFNSEIQAKRILAYFSSLAN